WRRPPRGKAERLARGVVLRAGARRVAGAGLGFGVPIVHSTAGWVYSHATLDVDRSTATTAIWQRTFQLDQIGGDAAHGYRFVAIPSRGATQVTYTGDSTGISVNVKVISLAAGYSEVVILNEQRASFSDFAAENQATL